MVRVLHDLLHQSADRFPDKEAVFFKTESLTYEQVAEASEAIGTLLGQVGVSKGDRVAIFLEKCFEKVIAIFGTSLAGGVAVPVRRLYHARQAAYIIGNSGAEILITTYSRLANFAEFLADMPKLRTIIAVGEGDPTCQLEDVQVIDWESARQTMPAGNTFPKVIESDLATILYTSGSTGPPKGVILSHLNIVAGARKVSEYLKICEQDRLLSILTFSFDYGLNQLTSAFLHGAQIVLLDYLFPRDVIRAVQRYQITGLAAVSTTWLQLLQLPWDGDSVPSLRYITNSGGAIPENYVRELRQRLPRASTYLMYGLTEAFRSTYLDPTLVDAHPTSIGRAIPGEEILVLDSDGQPVQPGQVGELVHRGVLVAQGYWNEPNLTSQRFRPNPMQPKEVPIRETVVYSGDYVRIDEEGLLYFIGRRDEMIKSAGNRVSPTEIEEVIYATDRVQDAIVMGIPHEIYGQAIKAILVPRPDASITEDELLAHCKAQLPPFMVPSDVEFRQELPRNANGKLDRSRVKMEVFEKLGYTKDTPND